MFPVLRRNNGLTPTLDEPFARLRNEVESLFGGFFSDGGVFPQAAWAGVAMAMWEDDDHVYIEADMPGLTEKDIEVSVENGRLSIRGERRAEENRSYLYNTRTYGRFERVISLPLEVDANRVGAKLTHGVLRIELAKNSSAKPKKISVQAG